MEKFSFPSRPSWSRRASSPALLLGLVSVVVSLPFWPDRSLGSGPVLARLDATPTTQPAPSAEQDEDEREVAKLALRNNCLICHSEEMVISQRLTKPQWRTEVEKMIGWGSPLPPDQVDPLITYLSQQYSDSTPAGTSARITYSQALAQVQPTTVEIPPQGSQADRGATLYATHCAACHAANAQGLDLGPNLVEVATLLRPADFLEVVRSGRHRMPGFQLILKPEQEKDILAWLQSKRFESAQR